MNGKQKMYRTIVNGLYLRFQKDHSEDNEKYSSLYLKEDPIAFESFAADILKKARGGSVWVSPPTGDFRVDFEHDTNDGKFIGQVKCKKNDLSYEPIAILHSNMMKDGVVGGYVITTSSFTKNAKKYAEGLNIELIDGVKLVELWIQGLQNKNDEIKKDLKYGDA